MATYFTTLTSPSTPSITAPTSGATGVSRNPTITSSSFVSAESFTHSSSSWQIATDSGFTSVVWSKADDSTNKTSIIVNATNGTFAGTLSGKTKLSASVEYFIRVRYKDSQSEYSAYSTGISFTTVPPTLNKNAIELAEFGPLVANVKVPALASKPSTVGVSEEDSTDSPLVGTVRIQDTSGKIEYKTTAGWKRVSDDTVNTSTFVNVSGDTMTGTLGVPRVQFDIAATPATNAEGLMQWNATDGTLDLGMSGGDIRMQLGQEMFMKVRNVSGSIIPNGSPVYISGRTGNRPNIYLAKSDAEATSGCIGLTTQDINSPADGFVTTFGYVRQIKTNYSGSGDWGTTWVEGDSLYISKSVAGQLTNVEPAAPHHSDVVGTVEIIGAAGIGAILVNTNQHKTLTELSDVDGGEPDATGDLLTWNNSTTVWERNTYNITNYGLLAGNQTWTGTNKFGSSSNHVQIDGSGELTMVGTATVWDDLRVTPSGFDRAGVADPSLVQYTPSGSGIATYLYEFQKDDIAYFTVQLPHSYKVGSDIKCHIHWTPGPRGTAENGKFVGWKIDYTWASINGNFGAMATVDLSDACDGTNHKHQMTPDVTISGTDKGISSMLICNVKRTDTGADDDWVGTASGELPMLLEIDFHYEIDSIGSKESSSK